MLRLGPQKKGTLGDSGRAPARQNAQGADGYRDQTMGSFRQRLKIGRVQFLRQPLAPLPAAMHLRLQYVHRAEAIDPDYDGESTRHVLPIRSSTHAGTHGDATKAPKT